MSRVNNLDEATALANTFLSTRSSPDGPLKLSTNLTEEHDFGWVFFFDAADPNALLAGNAPFIVTRNTGAIHSTGTAYPTGLYIESFARVGRAYPFATPIHIATIAGYHPGLLKISLTKLIRHSANLGLADAKRSTDDILEGKPVSLVFPTECAADLFSQRAAQLGAVIERSTAWH